VTLPQTFCDGIIFSLELGIEYLWIDALCIVQDDTKDWEIESAKVADIYQNYYLTLAATTSSSDTEGCFSVNHKPVQEYNLSSGASIIEAPSIMVREKVKPYLQQSFLGRHTLCPQEGGHFKNATCHQEFSISAHKSWYGSARATVFVSAVGFQRLLILMKSYCSRVVERKRQKMQRVRYLRCLQLRIA
jgi:hypothetical protein